MAEITAEQVAQAEAELVALKADDPADEVKQAKMHEVADIRSAYRLQEEQAGRRDPGNTATTTMED